jgi:Flp pilus assembly protein TadG
VLVTFTLAFPFLLVPLVGLAIDGTVLYSVKAKLQTAVDGSAIAAAQALNSGMTWNTQEASAETTAKQFIRANLGIPQLYDVNNNPLADKPGYWGSTTLNYSNCDANGTPSTVHTQNCVIAAQDNINMERTVQVSASVNVPLLFMRVLGFSNATVAAKGQAARRDVVLVFAIDRSSSMNNVIAGVPVITTLISAAQYFVSQFQTGRDRLGLVVFGGSAMVAYPRGDWLKPLAADGQSLTGATGADTSFQDADTPAAPNMVTSIGNIQVGSNTATAEALWLAYLELKAAAQPGALNVIVLFTDGHPNGISANFNNNTGTTVIKNTSPCTYNPNDGGNSAHSMIGWMAQGGSYHNAGNNAHGINTLSQLDNWTQTSITAWMGNPTDAVIPSGAGQPGVLCSYAPTKANYQNYTATDFTQIPTVDRYGNSTLGTTDALHSLTDYKKSGIWNDADKCKTGGQPASIDLTKLDNACQVGLASWNAADMAGMRIRADVTYKPIIYTMGFTGNAGGTDIEGLQRISNIKLANNGNSSYNSAQNQGMTIQINTPADIAPAFQSVLAEILRLSM